MENSQFQIDIYILSEVDTSILQLSFTLLGDKVSPWNILFGDCVDVPSQTGAKPALIGGNTDIWFGSHSISCFCVFLLKLIFFGQILAKLSLSINTDLVILEQPLT